ncbi:hypothetical protein PVL29_013141 [Vitis rotundifolia]|uniref:Uncharacterized protein n=1 Tax=Vitis rotundifolia TaxID=103349 RepID=A0AA38ZM34_VITRO|nr:hypothetical protein PVL29_013141 [Vitis rotundifolia]
MTFLCWLLMWFEAIFGLRVILDKSEPIPIGRVENVEELVSELGCKVGRLSFTYLGMSLGASFKVVATWDRIEERFHKRLAMWKQQYISKGWENHLDSKHFVQPTYLFHVYSSIAKGG